jgi:hypothetical protein
MASCFLIGYAVSLLAPTTVRRDLDGLTIFALSQA